MVNNSNISFFIKCDMYTKKVYSRITDNTHTHKRILSPLLQGEIHPKGILHYSPKVCHSIYLEVC